MELWFALSPLLFVVGFVFLLRHYHRELDTISMRGARLLRDLPVTPIAQATSGVVKFVGVTHGPQSVTSYFDRAPCVVHRMVKTTYEGSARAGNVVTHTYRTDREWQLFPFQIDDGTGRVWIDPRSAAIDYEVCHPEEHSAVLEHRIRLGDKVAIVGRIEALPDTGYRGDGSPERVRFVSPPLISWRTDDEFLPKLRPPPVPVALMVVGALGAGAAVWMDKWVEMLIAAGCSGMGALFFLLYAIRLTGPSAMKGWRA